MDDTEHPKKVVELESNDDQIIIKKKRTLLKKGVITICLLPTILIIRYLLGLLSTRNEYSTPGNEPIGPLNTLEDTVPEPYFPIVIFQAVGILAFVSLLLFPFGVYRIYRSRNMKIVTDSKKVPTKGKLKNLDKKQVFYIHKFSGSAFLFPLTRALGNGLRVRAFGTLIPIFNIYVWYKLSFYGKSIAWEKSKWKSFDGFKKTQQVLLVINLIIMVIIFIYVLNRMNRNVYLSSPMPFDSAKNSKLEVDYYPDHLKDLDKELKYKDIEWRN